METFAEVPLLTFFGFGYIFIKRLFLDIRIFTDGKD